jgi:hypothetical protein
VTYCLDALGLKKNYLVCQDVPSLHNIMGFEKNKNGADCWDWIIIICFPRYRAKDGRRFGKASKRKATMTHGQALSPVRGWRQRIQINLSFSSHLKVLDFQKSRSKVEAVDYLDF